MEWRKILKLVVVIEIVGVFDCAISRVGVDVTQDSVLCIQT